MSVLEREGADAARHDALQSLIGGASVRPVFHPIQRLSDRSVVGHEALSRAAIRAAARLPRPCRLFLNASARAILDPDWLEGETPGLLGSVALRPDEVVVEVTERLAVSQQVGFEAGLRALEERGYRVAVDDMGAGYASLQTLAAVEPDFLKFDTQLVRDIDRSSIKRGLLDSLQALAGKLRARVIAEGIEREEERATLIRLGIEPGQGYLSNREEPA